MPNTIQLLRPHLPNLEALEPFLARIDSSHTYSNYGPIWSEFKAKFEGWLNPRLMGAPVKVCFTSNGTSAIELCLRNIRRSQRTICAMPSYTFIATAHAAVNSGLEPYLLDVDQNSLALTPELVYRQGKEFIEALAAVVVVSVFGAPIDTKAWEAFHHETGVPVVFDAAAGLTALNHSSFLPICVSLHATKLMGIGEGGAVICSDQPFINDLTEQTGFGFVPGSRLSTSFGGNYRLSEFACAVGIAQLAQLDLQVEKLMHLAKLFRKSLGQDGFTFQDGFGEAWVSSTLNVSISKEKLKASLEKLDVSDVPWRRWWGLGTHTHPAFFEAKRGDLSNTNKVAPQIIGLPFHLEVDAGHVEQISSILNGAS